MDRFGLGLPLLLLLIFATPFSVVVSQTLPNLPDCAQGCLENELALAPSSGCASNDYACLCNNENFLSDIGYCLDGACTPTIMVSVEEELNNYCAEEKAAAVTSYITITSTITSYYAAATSTVYTATSDLVVSTSTAIAAKGFTSVQKTTVTAVITNIYTQTSTVDGPTTTNFGKIRRLRNLDMRQASVLVSTVVEYVTNTGYCATAQDPGCTSTIFAEYINSITAYVTIVSNVGNILTSTISSISTFQTTQIQTITGSESVITGKSAATTALTAPLSTSLLSILQTAIPVTAQTDPLAACFLVSAHSTQFTTPDWYTSLPSNAASYFSSLNAGAAATVSCAPSNTSSTGPSLSPGAKGGIGVGAATGAGIVVTAIVLALMKAGLLTGIGGGIAASAGGGAMSGAAAGGGMSAAGGGMSAAGGGMSTVGGGGMSAAGGGGGMGGAVSGGGGMGGGASGGMASTSATTAPAAWNGVAGSGAAGWNGLVGTGAGAAAANHAAVPIVPPVAGSYQQRDQNENRYGQGNSVRPVLQPLRSNSSQHSIPRKNVASSSVRETTVSPVSLGEVSEGNESNVSGNWESTPGIHPDRRFMEPRVEYSDMGGYVDNRGYGDPNEIHGNERFESGGGQIYEANSTERYEAPNRDSNGSSYVPYRPQ